MKGSKIRTSGTTSPTIQNSKASSGDSAATCNKIPPLHVVDQRASPSHTIKNYDRDALLKMKPWLGKSLKILTVLVLLLSAAWIIENWRGQRAWNKAKDRAAQAEVSLDLANSQPPKIPDDENLLKNDHFSHEWSGHVEPRLARWSELDLPGTKAEIGNMGTNSVRERTVACAEFFEEPLSEEGAVKRLNEASSELQMHLDQLTAIILSYPGHPLFNYPPTEKDPQPPMLEPLNIRKITESICDQATLNLRTRKPQKAIGNIHVINILVDIISGPPIFHHLISTAVRAQTQSIIWEGLRLQAWEESQLQELLQITDPFEPFNSLGACRTLKIYLILPMLKFGRLLGVPEFHIGQSK